LAKPIVDGLARTLEGQAQVLRLSVTDDVGGELAMRYGVRSVPTFVLLDGAGKAVLKQAGMPDRAEVESVVAGLLEG
jgi:thioredoxin-related protein